jgi:hypothetical protein
MRTNVENYVMLLGITDLEAEQVDQWAEALGYNKAVVPNELPLADLKAVLAYICDDFRETFNIELEQLDKGEEQ